jgi:hypothetical protein
MRRIIVFLCLGLIGCATTRPPVPPTAKKPVAVNELEMDSIISVFTDAINKDPNYAGAYYNRAIAYYYKRDYEKSWRDVYVAQTLGTKFSDDFLNSLKKVSHREK